jgi:hypothetical protein
MGYCTYVGRIGVHPHTFRDYTSSEANSATSGVYRQDRTAKPVVGVIETVIVENEASLAGGGGIEL